MKSINIINYFLLFVFVGLLSFSVSAQELKWSTEFDFFFDNAEYSKSNLAYDQTLTGVAFAPTVALKVDERQALVGGVDFLQKFGSDQFLHDIRLLAYYHYNTDKTELRAGVFKRSDLLNDYSNLFLQDSVGYYKRTMEGVYLKQGNEQQYFKLWLDWTGLKSADTRETFFVGASGYKRFGSIFFADFQSYLFHYATTYPNPDQLAVSDNFMGQLSGGFRLINSGGNEYLTLSAGVLAGFERDRKEKDEYKLPVGLVVRADGRYRKFGMDNLLYLGDKRMNYYNRYGNELYWGNPFLRSGSYFQNKIYWDWMNTRRVKGQLASRTHVSERKIHFEQLLTIHVLVDAPEKTKPRRPENNFFDFFFN